MPDHSIETHCTSDKIYTLDTNVLVYSIDRAAGRRHETAKHIMTLAAVGPCCLTLQSISEFYAVATRKGMLRPVEAVPIAEAMIHLFRIAAASTTAVRAALSTAAAGLASYWDALLVMTAAEAGCTTVLSEDMSDGSVLGGVRILNPFARRGISPAAEAILKAE